MFSTILAAVSPIMSAAAESPHVANSAATAPASLDFGAVLADVSGSTLQSLRDAENVASASIAGKASARDVVERMMSAEQNLQIAISVRDKVITAIQEISRMTI